MCNVYIIILFYDIIVLSYAIICYYMLPVVSFHDELRARLSPAPFESCCSQRPKGSSPARCIDDQRSNMWQQ